MKRKKENFCKGDESGRREIKRTERVIFLIQGEGEGGDSSD